MVPRDGHRRATTFLDSGKLLAVTPSSAVTGLVDVRAENPDSQADTLQVAFDYTGDL